MIVWGSCVATWERAVEWLLPGLGRNTRHGDLTVLTQADHIGRAYNQILHAAPPDAIVVLLHDDVELGDGARRGIECGITEADVVGPIGAANVKSLAWWEGQPKGRVSETRYNIDHGTFGSVDVLDGLLLAFGPWVRPHFDLRYPPWHGYDADICARVRSTGQKIAAADIPCHHYTKGGFGDRQAWDEADRRWRGRWL